MDNINRIHEETPYEAQGAPVIPEGLAGFLRENAESRETYRDVVVSTRFRGSDGNPMPFRLRALSGEELQQIQDSAVIRAGKTSAFRMAVWYRNLLVASVETPNLNNAELQNSYGVMSPADLLNAMLTGGEYNKLVREAVSFQGLDEDYRELVDDAKNE